MSTKIYNGYCIPNYKKEDFQNISQTLRSKTHDLISHDFEVLYRKLFTGTIQKLMVEDYKVGYGKDKGQAAEKIRDKLQEMYALQNGFSYYQKQFSNPSPAPSVYQLYRDSQKYPGYFAYFRIKHQIYECLLAKKELAAVSGKISSYDTLSGSVGFFPLKDKLLLLGYDACNQVLEEMVRNGNELGIEEYAFWNNTDWPEHITEEEWEQRREDWKTALPDGVPAHSGMFLEIGKQDDFMFSKMYQNITRDSQKKEALCDFSAIRRKTARQIYLEEQLAAFSSLEESGPFALVRYYHENKEKIYESWNETDILKIAEKLPKLPEGKSVLDCIVFDFIPNYMEKYLYPLEQFISGRNGGK